MVPEANRQKFRNCEKQSNQTFVEFARTKEQLFDRWCDSKTVGKEYKKLRELFLVEEFKPCIHVDIRTFVNEQQAKTLNDAARLADDFSLTHKILMSHLNTKIRPFRHEIKIVRTIIDRYSEIIDLHLKKKILNQISIIVNISIQIPSHDAQQNLNNNNKHLKIKYLTLEFVTIVKKKDT